jgi:HSP20 family molecular chaperone IbpA
MLSDAIEALFRAERMHRQFFQLQRSAGAREPAWEPPVDVLETDRELLVFVALPGIEPGEVEAAIEDGALVVAGRRLLPPELHDAIIHRLELPHGRFERRIPLPPGRYAVRRAAANGCLLFSLAKTK